MKIEQIVASVLQIDSQQVTDQTSPQNCGAWTSLKHLLLIKKIMQIYSVNLSIVEIKNLKSVGDIKRWLTEKGIRYE